MFKNQEKSTKTYMKKVQQGSIKTKVLKFYKIIFNKKCTIVTNDITDVIRDMFSTSKLGKNLSLKKRDIFKIKLLLNDINVRKSIGIDPILKKLVKML